MHSGGAGRIGRATATNDTTATNGAGTACTTANDVAVMLLVLECRKAFAVFINLLLQVIDPVLALAFDLLTVFRCALQRRGQLFRHLPDIAQIPLRRNLARNIWRI